jgi:NAD(P)-dependent dehydrogenase (short-subunit alcohol dehydrogenase family)
VNISSDLGLIAPDQRLYKVEGLNEEKQSVKPVTYSIIKTGLIGLTRYVATYWGDKNVRCNAVCPGGVENNQDIKFVNELIKRIPMNRMAIKNEYQGILIFLLSNASSYVNGAIISADGGRTTW